MDSNDMVIVNGVRYRPEDAPKPQEEPKPAQEPTVTAKVAQPRNKARTASNKAASGD